MRLAHGDILHRTLVLGIYNDIRKMKSTFVELPGGAQPPVNSITKVFPFFWSLYKFLRRRPVKYISVRLQSRIKKGV